MIDTLTFTLPEDRAAMARAHKADDLAFALWDIAELFRDRLKYGDLPSEQVALIEEMRDEFNGILDEKAINVAELCE